MTKLLTVEATSRPWNYLGNALKRQGFKDFLVAAVSQITAEYDAFTGIQ
jgi:hypothetical protein